MKQIKKIIVSIMVAIMLVLSFAGCTNTPKDSDKKVYGEYAYSVLEDLDSVFTKRVAGTYGEVIASNYVASEFEDMGYTAIVQPFTYVKKEVEYASQNVIVKKSGTSGKTVIVGAHYDCSNKGNGIDDNGSGLAVMLEAAKYFADKTVENDIIFIAFGAEEVGCKGSDYYVSQMSESEIQNTILYINLDSVGIGDYNYIHASTDTFAKSIQDKAISYASTNSLQLKIQEGLSVTYNMEDQYEKGTTGDWSDHAAFNDINIPFIYFESTNWEIDIYDGYVETESQGSFWHTPNDNLTTMNELFPGRIAENMKIYSELLVKAVELYK